MTKIWTLIKAILAVFSRFSSLSFSCSNIVNGLGMDILSELSLNNYCSLHSEPLIWYPLDMILRRSTSWGSRIQVDSGDNPPFLKEKQWYRSREPVFTAFKTRFFAPAGVLAFRSRLIHPRKKRKPERSRRKKIRYSLKECSFHTVMLGKICIIISSISHIHPFQITKI